ncbi:unnamed protein product [Ilex paraguariensis]|uniref:Hexosyltransferase n=1 Tax=Ilex paraguariensis TaxID=185542 RepID=A0ABC8RSF4_9AQUA
MREEPITLDEAKPVIKSLSFLIFKAHYAHYDIATTIMTMKSHIQALEQRASTATVQNTVFGQLAAEALPKNLHCITFKLMAYWLKKKSIQELADEQRTSPRLVDNNLYHFCIFSDNLLAVSVVVNSTISNAEHPKQLVFHIVTNGVNYGAMQAWFLSNDFKGSMIEVQNIENFGWLNASYSPVVRQLLDANSWAHYFEGSQDVIFLDDVVVVQKDLIHLFSVELHGNVNGAVETCLEAFHRYYKYINFSNPIISSKTCGWAFGMNVFDLIAWRKANVTAKYHYWQEQNTDRMGLLAFYGLTEPLDRRWHVLGLGYHLNI